MPPQISRRARNPRLVAIYWVTALVLVLAPLIRAGQDPIALAGLQLAAVALLIAALWRRPAIGRGEALVIALLIVVPLLYLVPLPLGAVSALPGRTAYLEVWRTVLGNEGLPRLATASLVPAATFSAWLTLLIPIAIFLGVRSLPHRQVVVLAYLAIGMATFQAILGLIQFGSGPGSPFYLGMEHTHFGSAVGTYTNRNHLAGLIEMTLPMVLALLFFNTGRGTDQRRGARAQAAFLGSRHGQEAFVQAALAVLLLVALAFTRSRMGIGLTMLGVLLSVALLSRRIGGNNAFGTVGTLAAIALGLAIAIGLVPVLDRFSAAGVVDDQRWTLFQDTIAGIGTFFPLGSGPGTFQDVFPAFQSAELGRWFINRAHNDYLEWAFEGGVAAIALIAVLLVVYATQWRRVWTAGEWSRLRFVQVGAGIGIVLILLHELVDYNLHIPANMAFFALLAGIFFSDATPAEESMAARSPRRTRRMGEEDTPVYAPLRPSKPAPDQIRNPFLDDRPSPERFAATAPAGNDPHSDPVEDPRP